MEKCVIRIFMLGVWVKNHLALESVQSVPSPHPPPKQKSSQSFVTNKTSTKPFHYPHQQNSNQQPKFNSKLQPSNHPTPTDHLGKAVSPMALPQTVAAFHALVGAAAVPWTECTFHCRWKTYSFFGSLKGHNPDEN